MWLPVTAPPFAWRSLAQSATVLGSESRPVFGAGVHNQRQDNMRRKETSTHIPGLSSAWRYITRVREDQGREQSELCKEGKYARASR
jgi:hypothetical protein